MIRVSNLSLPVEGDLEQLKKRAARELGIRPGQVGELELLRQSIDARRKDELHYVYTVGLTLPDEAAVVRAAPGKHVDRVERRAYELPRPRRSSSLPPVVVGMGPGGLFAALTLARAAGAAPEKTLYVGDSAVDVNTARNAGMSCAWVSWGFRSREDMASDLPEAAFDTTQALADYILGR